MKRVTMHFSLIAGIGSIAVAGTMFAGAELYYLREQAAGVWTTSATGDPLTILPQLGIVFVALAIPFILNSKLAVRPSEIRVISMVVLMGCLAALATGFISFGGIATPGGVWWNDYGFPVAWRVDVMVSCPPFCNSSDQTIYNPLFYAMDALFYISICYSAVIIGLKDVGKSARLASNQRIGLSEVRMKEIEGASPS
jgi:hypothetical protein